MRAKRVVSIETVTTQTQIYTLRIEGFHLITGWKRSVMMTKCTVNEVGGNASQPIRSDGVGAIDSGPRNVMRDIQNPNMFVPPITDVGLVLNLKFSFLDTSMILK